MVRSRQVEVGFLVISYSKQQNFISKDTIDYHSRQANTPYTWHEMHALSITMSSKRGERCYGKQKESERNE